MTEEKSLPLPGQIKAIIFSDLDVRITNTDKEETKGCA